MSRSRYQTKQMTQMLTFLESRKGTHVTAGDISAYFKEQGISVGTTTVYRHLERMVEQGLVAKYVVDGSSSACYEYIGESCIRTACYHCKCEVCGKLIHLPCEEVENLSRHMKEHHDFVMDPQRTVFYGICSACRGEKNVAVPIRLHRSQEQDKGKGKE